MSSQSFRRLFCCVAPLVILWPTPLAAQIAGDAYLDPGARELVRHIRERRTVVDEAIRGYETIVRERISAGFEALMRDRLLYRRELAVRVEWRRDAPIRIEVLGAREAVPIAIEGVSVPDDLGDAGDLAFDPAEEDLLIGLSDDDVVRHPLLDGSERDYRFSSGDTTEIRLPSGRTIRLIELRVHPRRDVFQLVTGSFWVDAATYDVVRATYRPAREFDVERDLEVVAPEEDDEDLEDIPGILMPLQLDVRYITVEYGLWEMRWWLPRLISFEGYASAGGFLKVPLRYDRTYSAYEVDASTASPTAAELATRAEREAAEAAAITERAAEIAADTASIRVERVFADLIAQRWKGECPGGSPYRCTCEDGNCRLYDVVLPDDSASLLTSELLPPSIFEPADILVSEAELEDLATRVRDLPDAPLSARAPEITLPWQAPGLLRYNRVEGLSAGVRVAMDLGGARADLTARFGTADLEPRGELGVATSTRWGDVRLAGYRRLAAAQAEARALGPGNSAAALLFGSDDGEYFRALGIELTGAPRPGFGGTTFEWRLFAERQRAAEVETQFSLRHALDEQHVFRPNVEAANADVGGVAFRLGYDHGLNPVGLRWGASLETEAAAGSFEYVRPSLTAYATFPVGADLLGALEAEAGISAGDVPPQRLWFIGGTPSLRGYHGAVAQGTSFWRGRAELANDFPAARIALFSDIGWAGPRDAFGTGRPLLSVGAGASLLDGILRLDVARALREPTGWRVSLYLGGIL